MKEAGDIEPNDHSNGFGKEVDRSLAEVITALLKPGATELGSLIGDAIGIASDRMKIKREANARLGLSEVKKKLDVKTIDLKAISPPTEEELHLLLNGLSLADDPNVRHLWAGLFAQALDPNSKVNAERPFISVLETLSPTDAKIIDFLAFIDRLDRDLKEKSTRRMPPTKLDYDSPEGKEVLARLSGERLSDLKAATTAIERKAQEYGLKELTESGWADNLLRQGIIVRPRSSLPNGPIQVRSLDERSMMRAFQELNERLEAIKVATERDATPPKRVFSNPVHSSQLRMEICFTDFGRRLAAACGIL
jgi:hypothetical protein